MGGFMYFKTLEGPRVYLSPICHDDAEKYARWLNDLEVADFIPAATSTLNLEKERDLLSKISEGHNYAIVDCKTDELIGNVGFVSLNQLHQNAEIGIFIGNKEYWDGGYGPESMSLLIGYGFSRLNLHSVFLRYNKLNIRAGRAYKKLGFRLVGEIRENQYRNGVFESTVMMDLLKNEFIPYQRK